MKKHFFIFYLISLICLTIFSYFFIDNNFIYLQFLYTGIYNQQKLLVTLLFLLFTTTFFLFYGYFLWSENNNLMSLTIVRNLILVTALIGLFAYPAMLSYDIFNYMATAKVTYFYHENPYIIMPIDFINDQSFIFTRATNKLALYGPVWVAITGIPYIAGFGNYLLALFGMKMIIVTFYLATVLIIWKMTRSTRSLVFFALNPLVIFEVLFSGHNDIVMVFLILMTYYLFTKKRIFFGICFFILSIFIKYATLFLLPVVFFAGFRTFHGQKIHWNKCIKVSIVIMFCVFLFSAFREEIYPWYAIWFLSFVSLLPKNKILIYFSIVISCSFLLRYIPFMLLGSYSGATPILKILLGFLPPLIFVIYVLVYKKVWLKSIYQ